MTKVVVPNHGPDHCPGGPDPIPCLTGGTVPWIWLQAGGQTLPGDGGFDPFLFDGLVWDPALVSLNPADVTDGSDGIFDIEILSHGGTDYYHPILRVASSVQGWYRFEITADIGDSGDGLTGGFWEVDMTEDSANSSHPSLLDLTWGHVWNGTDYFLDVMRHVFHLWPKFQCGYGMQTRQNTTTNKDLTGGMMIHYLGSLGGTTDATDWEVVGAP